MVLVSLVILSVIREMLFVVLIISATNKAKNNINSFDSSHSISHP